jgi:AcrR family transcriptional regulator
VGTAAARRAAHSDLGNARGERTRRSILDAARRVFERGGYFDVNVEDIVAEAGVARGSFYTYFPSKLEVFRELSTEVGAQIDRAVSRTDNEKLDAVEALERSNRRYIEVYRDNAAIYGLMEQIATMDPEVHQRRLQSRQTHVSRVAATIRRWQRRGVAEPSVDPVLTSAALVSMTSNFCYWWFVGPEERDEQRAVSTITEMWVRAVDLRRRPKPSWAARD